VPPYLPRLLPGELRRIQRTPRYEDEELAGWFAELRRGYDFKEAAERALLVWDWVKNTYYSDDDLYHYAIDLCVEAGARIRAGVLPAPQRRDGLYDQYL
jgi:hypothetical protein